MKVDYDQKMMKVEVRDEIKKALVEVIMRDGADTTVRQACETIRRQCCIFCPVAKSNPDPPNYHPSFLVLPLDPLHSVLQSQNSDPSQSVDPLTLLLTNP